MVTLPAADIRRLVREGLQEDLGNGDVTTAALFTSAVAARGTIIAKEPLVVAGMAAAVQSFLAVDTSLFLSVLIGDGGRANAGDVLMQLQGDGRSMLMAERVALNFLQHLSGIATLTRRFCQAVQEFPAVILDTRKTLPGWRALQKWAVSLGGGLNHRLSLEDGILIKDNHLALLNRTRRTVKAACRLAHLRSPTDMPIIVEVETLPEVKQALAAQADVILLDNMSVNMVKRAVALIRGRALVEVSGGISLTNVRAMAAAGADRISIGALTHSASAADVSLELTRVRSRRRR
ncbi:Nicotinate-nucleotide diphosphorylase [Nitrospira sp. KM1]|uniref:carboxylating nicotinate-nucleotide diphosphorylase n=1 Tax=Nitrospira sp. KM1 TaxID=1936990 RepID=UPI0013A73948|nr:carboxylating nicotinate-nucleotide diphosphorylase [Nitrospira sp. KM1]BCA53173.1 Nicotinate-nucleotide diphosphorylase [Nitrospira sp. KM1]